jgi:hypothetical protein
MAVANTLAYQDMVTIMTFKIDIVQTPVIIPKIPNIS